MVLTGADDQAVAGDGVINVQFAQTGDNIAIDYSEVLAPAPEPLTFEISSPATMLISNGKGPSESSPSDPYPPFQDRLGQDGVIPIKVTAYDKFTPAANRLVYFRVTDPPDSAPYASRYAKARDNNEHLPTTKKEIVDGYSVGTLSGLTLLDPDAAANIGEPVYSGVADANGVIEFILNGPKQSAGDNYVVEASFNPQFNCTDALQCGSSATITAWKRMYVETSETYRKGAFITRNANPGDSKIYVSDQTMFRAGDSIELLHAPPLGVSPGPYDFYKDGPYAIYKVDTDTTFSEVVGGQTRYGAILYLGSSKTTPASLAKPFVLETGNFSGTTTYLNDAVGVVNTPATATWQIDRTLFDKYLQSAFGPAFVEFKFRSKPVNVMTAAPYILRDKSDASQDVMPSRFSKKWSYYATRGVSSDPVQPTPEFTMFPNYIHFISAGESKDIIDLVNCTASHHLGETGNAGHSNYSYVYIGRITSLVAQADSQLFPQGSSCRGKNVNRAQSAAKISAETAVHEFAHQWHVNEDGDAILYPAPTTTPTTGHDYEKYWTSTVPGSSDPQRSKYRTMDSKDNAAEMADDYVGFHLYGDVTQPTTLKSEYLTIRRRVDPNY